MEQEIDWVSVFGTMFRSLPITVWAYDETTLQFLDVNETGEARYGFSRAEFLERSLYDVRSPADRQRLTRMLERTANRPGPHSYIGLRHRTRGGTTIDVDVAVSRSIDFNGRPARIAFINDVTDRTQRIEDLSALAYTDPATRLPTRFALEAALEATLINRGAAIALIHLGLVAPAAHRRADVLARTAVGAARRLAAHLPEGVTLYRFSDDVFAALSPEEDGERLLRAWTRVATEQFDDPVRAGDASSIVRPAIGMATVTEAVISGDELLARARTAVDAARRDRAGRTVEFTNEIGTTLDRAALVERHLHNAVVSGELRMVYQPVVSLEDGEVRGVEALVRWDSRALGAVRPDEFIPLAEESGYIERIGAWVMNETFSEYVSWNIPGRRPRLLLNVSPRQFQARAFFDTVMSTADRTGMQLSDLEIEITETAIMDDPAASCEVLRELRKHGASIAVDDFGSGYSSLSYLMDLPLDTVKLDRSFVTDLPGDARRSAVVSAVCSLAHDIGLRVIAEGVETTEQREQLTALGCDFGQGYLFARPHSGVDLRTLLGDRWAIAI